MSLGRAEVLRDLRAVLRHWRSLPSASRSPLLDQLKEKTRLSLSLGEDQQQRLLQERRMLAAYAENVRSVNELIRLRALDTGEKMTQRERVEAMAKRVGLGVAQPYNEDMESPKCNDKKE